MNRIEILVRDFVDDVERYCMHPGVWRDRNAYRSYVIQTCKELHRGGTTPAEASAEALRAVLLVIAPTISPPPPTSLGLELQNIVQEAHFSKEWRDFTTACSTELDRRSKHWPATFNVGGTTVELAEWIDDKHYDTVTLRGSRNLKPPPTHGVRRRGRK